MSMSAQPRRGAEAAILGTDEETFYVNPQGVVQSPDMRSSETYQVIPKLPRDATKLSDRITRDLWEGEAEWDQVQ